MYMPNPCFWMYFVIHYMTFVLMLKDDIIFFKEFKLINIFADEIGFNFLNKKMSSLLDHKLISYDDLIFTGLTFQIFSAYSLIERSLENLPTRATFKMDFFVHSSVFLYKLLTLS